MQPILTLLCIVTADLLDFSGVISVSSLTDSDFSDSLNCPGIKLFSIINGISQLKIVKSIITHSKISMDGKCK